MHGMCRTEAREQLRRQVGTLRFDLNALADLKPKPERKAALALKVAFLKNVRPAFSYCL
jgi:photosystem II oxygen-evolving enhancer protein 3